MYEIFRSVSVAVLLLLCALVAIAHADIEGFYSNGCPKDHSIHALLPHQNCNQYYQCLNGVLLPRFCPAGLYFNAELEICDWNGENKCQNNHVDKKRKKKKHHEELDHSNPKHVRVICSNFDSNGEVVAHENCNQFYKCSQGEPMVHKCPPSLMYDPAGGKCDWASNVDCNGRMVPDYDIVLNKRDTKDDKTGNSEGEELDTGNNDPNQALRLCSTPGSDGVLVSHENCNQFYKCFNGSPVAMLCPEGLLYNSDKAFCDWPQNVYCGERATPGNDENSVEIEVTSPSNTNINEGENDPDLTSSENKKVNHIENSDPRQAQAVCKALNSEGVLVAHDNCRHFYKCVQGFPVELSCPGILLYNSDKGYCDWPNNVNCGDRYVDEREDDINASVSDPPRHDNPNDAPSICAALGSDGILVAHEKCNQFYKCHEGLPVALKCPSNLMYNSEKQYCDWPANVECGDRVMLPLEDIDVDDNTNDVETSEESGSSGYHDPSEAPVICAAVESNGILIAHENCNQFYKCFEGKPVTLFCPPDLLYNPGKEYCDWPHNVYCGERLGPQGNDSETGSNEVSDEPKPTCNQSADGDVIPHENCSQFYKCHSGKGYPMDCPPGLNFNAVLKVCDWAMNVKCGDRLTEEQGPNQTAQISRHARN